MPGRVDIDPFWPYLDRPHAYNFEANRFSTFEANPACFHACHTSRRPLAKQGFYSTGNGDEVKCYKCRQSHYNWQPEQELHRIHRQLSPICPSFTDDDAAHQGVLPNIAIPLRNESVRIYTGLLNGFEGTTPRVGVQESGIGPSDFSVRDIVVYYNVRLRDQPGQTAAERSQPVPREGNRELPFTAEIVDIPQWGHLHSEFSSALKREHTLDRFPHKRETRLICSLKRHGFFFVGHDDIVMCFSCGLALNRWEPGDDPRAAHVRWTRGSCKHLRIVESDNYIAHVLRESEVVGSSG